MSPTSRSRFPSRVYGVGNEPDPRFTLANERTFLAWIRTALALIAAGVALQSFNVPMHAGLRMAASIVLLGLGILVPALAWFSWGSVESALRRGAPLPSSRVAVTLAAGVITVAAVMIAGLLIG